MRSFRCCAALVVCALGLAAPGLASAQGNATVGGFGGLSITDVQSQRPSLGGTVTFNLIPQMQIVGEVGRIGNVLPTLSNTIFSVTDSGVRASAFYGEGGIRLLAAPRAAATPYGEATAGMARLDITSDRLGTYGNLATSLALGFIGRTMPVASVGGGLLVRGGPIVFDLGYRYKQLFADPVLQDALGLGQPLRAHQVRAGISVRF